MGPSRRTRSLLLSRWAMFCTFTSSSKPLLNKCSSALFLQGLGPLSFIFYISSEKYGITIISHFKSHMVSQELLKFTRIMGGSASSQTAGPDGKIKNTDKKNFGLINLSSESDTNLNLVEIATRAGVAIVVLYLLSWYCQWRK